MRGFLTPAFGAAVALCVAAPLAPADARMACPKGTTCIVRPLDPRGVVRGEIPVVYKLYPHTDRRRKAVGTIVTQEGGPGAPATGSAVKYYLPLFDVLRAEGYDVLMVDARGTGATALRCPELHKDPDRNAELFGKCGRSLGPRAVLYGTRLAVEDMKAVLDHLKITEINYYGDSYATFFGQVFAAMYPGMLRTVVLDGAFPVKGQSPWSPHGADAVRDGFNAACARSPACARLGGTSIDRIRRVVEEVRAHPFEGTTRDARGKATAVTVNVAAIGLVLWGGGAYMPQREMDAAARAWFDGDRQPLVRLVAEARADLSGNDLPDWSYALYGAVSCLDYQQIYDMRAPIAARKIERDRAIAEQQARDPRLYDPLTIDDFARVSIDTSLLDQCLYWPIDNPPYPPGRPIPDGAAYTLAPTLVLNGEFDTLTPPGDGAAIVPQFPNARHVVVANSFHVTALGDLDNCAENIVRAFVRTAQFGDVSCAAAVRPVRLVPAFARRAADVDAAEAADGNQAGTADLALAAAAVQTAGDVMARFYNGSEKGRGLRGGTWSWSKTGEVVSYRLKATRWAGDLAVRGSATWNQDSGAIRADIRYRTPRGRDAHLIVTWNDHVPQATAAIRGTVGGRRVRAAMPAP